MTNTKALSARDLHEIEVLDCGDPQGLRYVVEAIATDPDDTTKVGSMFVCGCYNREVADMIAASLQQKPQPEPTSQFTLERIARVLAQCRETGTFVPDLVANAFEIEFSNTGEDREFRRMYESFARTRGER